MRNYQAIREILIRYKDLLEKDNFPVRKMILFGSYARGGHKFHSDIDVCVLSDKFIRNKDYYEAYLWKKVLEVDPRIEPVAYHPKDFQDVDPLVNEIKKHGIPIP